MQPKDSFYLNKYAFKMPQIQDEVSKHTGIVVTIPCHNELYLIPSLEAIWNCDSTACEVEVIVIINASETASEDIKQRNLETLAEAELWYKEHKKVGLRFHFILENDLPKKHAGVGLARKIIMDEASWRFESIGKMNGVITCFDADSLCDSNYLLELEQHFNSHPKTPGCSIHFEHPVSGDEYSMDVYQGITEYELHLRYYRQAMKYTGHPAAFHTIGSSMAVRAEAYQKQGGMNRRKAGEDFYFLQKIISLGKFTELKTTRVIPSPRPSDRVPFGTGRAIGEWLEKESKSLQTYNLKSFRVLKSFFSSVDDFYENNVDYSTLSNEIKCFILENEFKQKMIELRRQSTNLERFRQRFYFWFDAFKILKFVHYSRDNHFLNESIISQCLSLLRETNHPHKNSNSAVDYLKLYRLIDIQD